MPIEQWVNLPKENKWATDGIDRKAFLGAVQVKFTFKSKKPAYAKYTLEAGPGGGGDHENAAYTDQEARRHLRFKPRRATGKAVVLGKTTVTAEIDLPAAGGNVFHVKAECRGEEQTSDDIETRRRMFYKSIAMEGVATPDLGTFEGTFWDPANHYYIQWVNLGGDDEIPAQSILNSAKDREFFKAHKATFSLGEHKPYGMTVIWVRKLFAPETDAFDDDSLVLDLPAEDDAFAPVTHVLRRSTTRRLRRDVEPNDDADKAWLDDLECTFTPDGEGPIEVAIPRDRIARNGENVEITITEDDVEGLRTDAARHGTFTFTGHLSTMIPITGFQSPALKAVVVATVLLNGNARSAPQLLQTLVHEAGHAVGMAAGGPTVPARPDRHASYYTRPHVGAHCRKPADGQELNYNAGQNRWTGHPGCVMFGGTGTYDGNAAPATFCDDCALQVRKLDLHSSALKV